MAEDRDDSERSQDPSQKKLDEAHKRGDVVKSQEVNTWFILAGGLLALYAFGAGAADGLRVSLRGLLGNSHAFRTDGVSLVQLVHRLGVETLAAVGLPLLVLALAALVGNLVQHRPVWSAEGLSPKLSRVSVLAGAKRLFSKQALANFVKGVLKLAVLGTLMVWLLWPERHRLDALVSVDPAAVLPLVGTLCLKLLGAVAIALGVVAAADFFFQYRSWFERQKMSLKEVKDEFKQTEGDPAIKGRIRQLRQSRMRKRMMAAVPKASVIVTNPTHYAVALQYEPGMNAPLCLAKGMDAIALKIRAIADQHAIPIVENPPLARALHASVEIDAEIPAEHYKAVAEVIGFIMRLRPLARS